MFGSAQTARWRLGRAFAMKQSADFDLLALDLFTSEGAPSTPDPGRPVCIASPGTVPPLVPRRMPALHIACPASEGAAQRYRKPLWRPFKAGP